MKTETVPEEHRIADGLEWFSFAKSDEIPFLYETRPYRRCPCCGDFGYVKKRQYRNTSDGFQTKVVQWAACSECNFSSDAVVFDG